MKPPQVAGVVNKTVHGPLIFTDKRTCEPNYDQLLKECPAEIFDSDKCTDEEGIHGPFFGPYNWTVQRQLSVRP